jgi:hypothetical protein
LATQLQKKRALYEVGKGKYIIIPQEFIGKAWRPTANALPEKEARVPSVLTVGMNCFSLSKRV